MKRLRTIVEKLSRNRVLSRHLPKDLNSAPIYVSPDSSLRLWSPLLQSDLFDLAREFVKPGCVVWDIGANVGLFSIAAAQKAGPHGAIIAIEPDPWLCSLLERSIAAQSAKAAPIKIMPVAVSGAVGVETLHIANRGRASNHLSTIAEHSQVGGTREAIEVRTITLDWLLEQGPPPALVKIDAEGAEIDLLHSSHRLLTEVRPIIMCESQHRNRPAVTTIFNQYNYKLYDWNSNPRVEVRTAAFNTLALPIQSART